MSKLKIVLAVILALMIVCPVFTVYAEETGTVGQVMQSYTAGANLPYVTDGYWRALVFKADTSFIMSGLSLDGRAYDASTNGWIIQFGVANQSTHKPGSTAITYWTFDTDNFPDATDEWFYFGGKAIELTAGTYYFINIKPLAATATSADAAAWLGNEYYNDADIYCWNSKDSGASWVTYGLDGNQGGRNFKIYGLTAQVQTRVPTAVPGVTTSVYLNGFVESMGQDTTLSASFEWGTDTDYGNETTPETVRAIGEYQQRIYSLVPDMVYHCRAKATGSESGTVYGDDVSFTVTSAQVFEVDTIAASDVTFESFKTGAEIINMANNTSCNITLQIGTTIEYELGDFVIDAAAGTVGVYPVNVTGLDYGQRYYFRAKAVGDNVTGYGQNRTILMPDPEKAAWLNTANIWWENKGWNAESAWWVILAGLIALAWLAGFSTKVGRILAAIFSGVIIGGAVALKLVDEWLVVILAIIVGFIITGLLKTGGKK
ncbi:MAG: hypothetical protein PHQ43_13565, partial [Dehalococcoidales bacterium]|nr:hypothetical protein [Dehalococcoidales bacterium]